MDSTRHLHLVANNRDVPLPGNDPERHYDPSFLRVVHGGKDDPERKFMEAYHAAAVARAERELAEALSLRDLWLSRKSWADAIDLDPHGRDAAFDRVREAVAVLAMTPACDKSHLRRKEQMIGTVWLKAKGPFYDLLRAGVENDRARLAGKAVPHG